MVPVRDPWAPPQVSCAAAEPSACWAAPLALDGGGGCGLIRGATSMVRSPEATAFMIAEKTCDSEAKRTSDLAGWTFTSTICGGISILITTSALRPAGTARSWCDPLNHAVFN